MVQGLVVLNSWSESRSTHRSKALRAIITNTYLWRVVIIVVLLGSWQMLVSAGVLDPFFVSSPLDVAKKLKSSLGFHSGSVWPDVAVTYKELALGLLVGCALGISLGYLLAKVQSVARIIDPFVIGLYSLPSVALAPLFILWFGIGLEAKVLFTSFVVFFMMFINTQTGVRGIEPDLIDSVRLMGASRLFVALRIEVRAALPSILTGLRLSAALGVVAAVISEIFASQRGLGHLLAISTATYDIALTFTVLVILAVTGASLNGLLRYVERKVLPWQDSK